MYDKAKTCISGKRSLAVSDHKMIFNSTWPISDDKTVKGHMFL